MSLLALLLTMVAAAPACASMSVLVGEPFGSFGTMMPLGHTALLLDEVCADGPLRLRACRPDEPRGVVLARYHAIGRYDWMASPAREFLWATEDPANGTPAYATPDRVWAMRERFRQEFLRPVVPDGTQGVEFGDGRSMGAGSLEEWWESAGMLYNRRVFAYQIRTSPEQDEQLIRYLNDGENHHLYHLKKTNCADFVADLVNVLYPGAVHNDRVADFGLMTPKEVARSLSEYAAAHPAMALRVWAMPQMPGSLARSRPVRGGAESGLKTKRYLLPLLVIQPDLEAYLGIVYLLHGRWVVGSNATTLPLATLPPPYREAPLSVALAVSGARQTQMKSAGQSEGDAGSTAAPATRPAGAMQSLK